MMWKMTVLKQARFVSRAPGQDAYKERTCGGGCSPNECVWDGGRVDSHHEPGVTRLCGATGQNAPSVSLSDAALAF